MLEIHKNSMMPHLSKNGDLENGYRDHIINASNKANIGDIINGTVLALMGIFSSLVNSFKASAIG